MRTIVYNEELDQRQASAVAIAKRDPQAAGEQLAGLVQEVEHEGRYYPEATGDTRRAHLARLRRDMGIVGLRLAVAHSREAKPRTAFTRTTTTSMFDTALELLGHSANEFEELRQRYNYEGVHDDHRHLSEEASAAVSARGRGLFAFAVVAITADAALVEALRRAEEAYSNAAELAVQGNNAYFAASNHIHLARLLRYRGMPPLDAIREAWRDVAYHPNDRAAARRTIFRVMRSMWTRRAIERAVKRGGI